MINCIIIGSGPAGLMAANVLEANKVNYILIDKNHAVGRKLLITGGTRCNVTNIFEVDEFINQLKIKNKRFLYSTLSSFGTKEVKEFFTTHGVDLKLEKAYQLFPKSSKSGDIVNALMENINRENLLLSTNVDNIEKTKNGYKVETNTKDYLSKNLIIATGSKSYPKTGSTGDGVIWGEELGHKIIPFYPAETHVYSQFVKKNKEFLQGISIQECELNVNSKKKIYKGDLIFTHFGLSGPLVQDISELLYFETLKGKVELNIKLTKYSEHEINQLFESKENQSKRVIRLLEKLTIKRLAKYILSSLNFEDDKLVASISKNDKQLIFNALLKFNVLIDRVESIENAFVNGGGISTNEINPATMESKINEGLYFIGETLNVHGPIGGFNITIALSTGYTAANNIRRD